MSKLGNAQDRALELIGEIGDGLRKAVPGKAMQWVETGAAIGAAAGFLLPFHTSYVGLHRRARLQAGESLLVVGAVVAEFVNADAGLGFLIQTSTAFFKVPVAFGALIILSVMGVVLFQIVVVAERVFFPWSSSNTTPGA